jgi:NDP-sugar pyrophosphorylase family protein
VPDDRVDDHHGSGRDRHNGSVHHQHAVKAVVLVGGEGTRLRPLTYTTPKPLLPIANQPFLERQLSWLATHGVTEVVLSLGYLPDAFESHFPSGSFCSPAGDLVLRYAVEDHPLGTAGAIRFAAEALGDLGERIVVCNGDVLTTLDLGGLVKFHDERGAEATIALTQVRDPSAFGVVPTRDDGEVIAFVEKPPPGKAPTNWINAGTYVLEPSVLARIPERLAVSIERETFPRMLEEPRRLYAKADDAYWIDIGTPEKYLQAHTDVLNGALPGAPVDDARELRPGVWAQGDVEIDDGATIEAPVLLGAGVRIAAGARVVASVLGAGVQVAHGARVARSVLLRDAVLDDDAEVIDSALGAGAHLCAGAIASLHTVVGAGGALAAGAHASGARIREAGATDQGD